MVQQKIILYLSILITGALLAVFLGPKAVQGIVVGGQLDMSNNKIINVGPGTSNTDVATYGQMLSIGSYWTQSGSNLYPNNTAWNVGIGTTAPGTKLDVNGNLKVGDNLIIGGYDNYKVYQNLASLDNYSGGVGAIVINTNIPFTAANMFTINIQGYQYGGGPWEVTVAAYAGESNIYNASYISVNKAGFGAPIIARNIATGNIAVILGTTGGTYNYLFTVTRFTQGLANRVESYADGWTITSTTNLTGYDYQTTCVDKSVFTGLIQSTASGASYITGGNVGIGTTVPIYKLDVQGTGSFTQPVIVGTPTAGSHATTKSYVDSMAGGGVGPGTSGQTLRHNGTSWVANSALFNDGTNVGIGTTVPGAKLEIGGVPDNAAALIMSQSGTAWQNSIYNYMAAGGNSRMDFHVALENGTNATVLSLKGNGNVGIGTTGPNQKLEVSGNIRLTSMDSKLEIGGANHVLSYGGTSYSGGYYYVTQLGDASNRVFIGVDRYNGNTSGLFSGNEIISRGRVSWMVPNAANNSYVGIWGAGASDQIFIGNWATPYEVKNSGAVTILSSGSVGIGTVGPNYKLDVQGTAGFNTAIYGNGKAVAETGDAFLRINQNNQFSSGIWMGTSDLKLYTSHLYVGSNGAGAGNVDIYGNGDATNRITINGSTNANSWFNTGGNVGIGTTNPGTNKLEVVGGPIKATGGLIIETRTNNPASPVDGQVWVCVDTTGGNGIYYDCQ